MNIWKGNNKNMTFNRSNRNEIKTNPQIKKIQGDLSLSKMKYSLLICKKKTTSLLQHNNTQNKTYIYHRPQVIRLGK